MPPVQWSDLYKELRLLRLEVTDKIDKLAQAVEQRGQWRTTVLVAALSSGCSAGMLVLALYGLGVVK